MKKMVLRTFQKLIVYKIFLNFNKINKILLKMNKLLMKIIILKLPIKLLLIQKTINNFNKIIKIMMRKINQIILIYLMINKRSNLYLKVFKIVDKN